MMLLISGEDIKGGATVVVCTDGKLYSAGSRPGTSSRSAARRP